jgi:hypothetical protein
MVQKASVHTVFFLALCMIWTCIFRSFVYLYGEYRDRFTSYVVLDPNLQFLSLQYLFIT